MVEIPRCFEADRSELDTMTVRIVTMIDGARAGKPIEQIIEAAIFLNDDDDVLNFGRGRRCRLGSRR